MQKVVCAILISVTFLGCVSIPKEDLYRPNLNMGLKCVHVEFKRLREGPVTRRVEEFSINKFEEVKFRRSLKVLGLETECESPLGVFEFTYVLRGGIKLPSVELAASLLTFLSMGLFPSKSDVIVEVSYIRKDSSNRKSINYLVAIEQWRSIFLITKEISQNKESRELYGIDNYFDSIVMAKTADLILKEIAN